MSLLSLDEARRALKLDDSDTSGDEELATYVGAITKVVEKHVGELIDQATVTERLRFNGYRFVLKKTPVVSLTSVVDLYGNSYPTTGMDLDPSSGVVEVFSGTAPCGTVIVTYTAGYDPNAIPTNYKRGAAIILQHIWETQRGVGNAFAGVIGEEERLNRTWMYEIPRKALEWLGPPAPNV